MTTATKDPSTRGTRDDYPSLETEHEETVKYSSRISDSALNLHQDGGKEGYVCKDQKLKAQSPPEASKVEARSIHNGPENSKT